MVCDAVTTDKLKLTSSRAMMIAAWQAAFAAVHELGCQHDDRQPHSSCRLSDGAHAELLTISARCLAGAPLIMPASEADMVPALAGDQVSDAAQQLEVCTWRSKPVRGCSPVEH